MTEGNISIVEHLLTVLTTHQDQRSQMAEACFAADIALRQVSV